SSPAQCHLPADVQEHRIWGWAAQLYATRSRESWGIGDLADLRRLKEWARAGGAHALMVNPLVAATPLAPIEASPYYPSSRRFRNPLYIRVEEAPGAAEAGAAIAPFADRARAMNRERRIDRDAIFPLKMAALERCFEKSGGDARFEAYRSREGIALQ